MSRRCVALVVAIAALAMIVAGCGGGSDSTESSKGSTESSNSSKSTSSVSKAEFVRKGNAICSKGEKEVEKGVETFAEENNLSESNPVSQKQVEELAEEVLVPAVRKQLKEIRSLEVPSDDAQEVEAILAAVEAALNKTEEDPSLFAKEGVGPFAKANKLAREYGLTACGEEPEESAETEEGK